MTQVSRRRFLTGLAATAAVPASAHAARHARQTGDESPVNDMRQFPQDVQPFSGVEAGEWPRTGRVVEGLDYPVHTHLPFAHGVASGDPLPDGIILWTRLTLQEYPGQPLQGYWRIAHDPAMSDILMQGTFETNAERDWTVKIDVRGLASYQVYYYQFYWNGAESCVGRTRTAPATEQILASVRFAVCACSSYYSGFMNGYGRIADRADIDFVVHCGDYIYDYPDEDEQLRIPNNNLDAQTNPDIRHPDSLATLRRRYALYRSDPDLFRAHQQHPWFIIWDNHDIATTGELTLAQAYQVFWEWTPSREVDVGDLARRHTRYRYGALLDVLFSDRHYPTAQPAEAGNPFTYLGDTQQAWLRDSLKASQQEGAQWRVVVNQAFIGQFYLINPPVRTDWIYRGLFPKRKSGFVINDDQWDGADADRRDLLTFLSDQQINNTIFVTGDMHMNWGSDVVTDPADWRVYDGRTGYGSVAVEFAPSSISRGGADETLYGLLGGAQQPWARPLAAIGSAIASAFLVQSNPNAQYMEWTNHGYGIVDVQSQQSVFEYWWTPIFVASTDQRLGRQLVCADGQQHLRKQSPRRATQRLSVLDKPLAYELDPALVHVS